MPEPAGPRVLRVIARLNVGGPARHVVILDRGLRLQGFQTLLAHGDVGRGEASLEQPLREAGIPARRIGGLGPRVSPFSDLRALAALVTLVFNCRPDIVHTHTAKAGSLGRIAAWLYNLAQPRHRRCAVIHTYHGHVLEGYFGQLATAVVRWIERLLARITDTVLVLSPQQQHDIGERFHVAPPGKIRVVPLGLELDPLLVLPQRCGHGQDVYVFGYVGRFVAIKNLPLLVEAFARVHRQCPGTRLLLVGDGETRPELQARVSASGLTAVVRFEGWQHDLPGVYGAMDALVLTSLNEGTPVAVIEAMAAGLPVVATAVGGVPDVVTHGATGILVPPRAVDPLAAALVRLVEAPEEGRRLGSAARAAVRTRFGAERLVADVARTYLATLEARRAAACS